MLNVKNVTIYTNTERNSQERICCCPLQLKDITTEEQTRKGHAAVLNYEGHQSQYRPLDHLHHHP